MEFEFNINNLISSEVSKFDSRLIPARNSPGSNEFRNQLFQVVDEMGEASAKAQGLHGPITSGRKMTYSDHILYIMKDSQANSGKGAVVGLLKIGTKKLFVYDNQGVHHEMDPMCVLDFYVHESRQRTGCGHKLFEYMLRDQNIKPAHLAVDKPSHKFSMFLMKHYLLKATIPQVNNFVIFTGFFHDRNSGGNSSQKNSVGRPPMHPYRKQNSQSHVNGYSGKSHQEPEADMEKGNIDQERSGIEAATTTDTNTKLTLGTENSGQKPPDTDPVGYGRHILNPTPPLPDIGQTHDSRSNSYRKVPSPPLRRKNHPGDFIHLLNTHQDVYDRFGHLKTSPMQPDIVQSRNKTAPFSIRHEPRTLVNDAQLKSNGEGYGNNSGERGLLLNGMNGRSEGMGAKANTKMTAMDALTNQNDSDVLLPKNFTPYKELSLPPGDPYSSRISAKRLNNTGWNIFGVPQESRSYSASDRWKNTRPW